MNSIDRKDMIRFHWKILIFQTTIYALIWCISYIENALTNDGKILWKPMVITYYSLSVLVTFIIPMIKLLKNNNE
jgi:hypothetical protein